MSFQRHGSPSHNPHPNHNHVEFNSDLNVHVTGGDRVERELLVDAISSSLKSRGFDGVKAIGPHGWNTDNQIVPPKTVLEAVTKMRPDLLTKDIAVTAERTSVGVIGVSPLAPVTFTASTEDGKEYSAKNVSGKNFVTEAGALGITDKITVSGTDYRAVAKQAEEVLRNSMNTEVTMKVELQPWQVGLDKRQYLAPLAEEMSAENPFPKRETFEYTAPRAALPPY